jgi:hypothetical protein
MKPNELKNRDRTKAKKKGGGGDEGKADKKTKPKKGEKTIKH